MKKLQLLSVLLLSISLVQANIDKDEYLYLSISNHHEGFFVAFFHYKNNEEVNSFENNYILLLEPNIFYSNNISNFLDKD